MVCYSKIIYRKLIRQIDSRTLKHLPIKFSLLQMLQRYSILVDVNVTKTSMGKQIHVRRKYGNCLQ